jgi:hypothetical protein
MKNPHLIIFSVFVLITSQVFGTDLQVTVPSKMVSLNGSNPDVILNPGEVNLVAIKSPALVTSVDRLPIILVPIFSGDSKITIESPLAIDTLRKASEEQMGRDLSKILTQVADIQEMIRDRKLTQATEKINALQTQYPHVQFFDFLKAGILLLQNNRAEAISLTEKTLKIYPDYKQGQEFLKNIRSSSR